MMECHVSQYGYSASLPQEYQDLRRDCCGCTVASSGVMVVESYVEIVELVKKLK
jgi:hypothetical protein